MGKPTPDQELVHLAQQGDLEAFETLAVRYERQIYSLARRILGSEHDAQDVTQSTFISALENLTRFRGDASFSTWIHRIATFAALKILRKRRGLDTISLEEAGAHDTEEDHLPHPKFIADWSQTPEELAARNETRVAIEAALTNLSDNFRLVFLLRDVQGLSVRETAEALGISEGNVKVRLLRARLQLREQLTRLFGDAHTAVAHHHPSSPPNDVAAPATGRPSVSL